MNRLLRCADHVLHRPTGEKWLLACDEQNGEIICCGWPETFARASDCDLLKAATDEERLELLREVAKPGRSDTRASRARYQLDLAGDAPVPA